MFKRIALFLLTNFMVIVTISLVMSIFGINGYLSSQGIDYKSLLIICALWGMGGALVSLFISKRMAKSSMKIEIIDPKTVRAHEKPLLDVVYGLAQKCGLTVMPEVGIYESAELNAFATGPSKDNALVAVSSGLLNKMDMQEIEGVLGHEISHVTNGDMVTMTLVQGTINAFTLFFSRIIAFVLSAGMSRGDSGQQSTGQGGGNMLFFMMANIFNVVFTLFGSLVVAAFSRHREYRADEGGARLAGKDKMINALRALQRATENPAQELAEEEATSQSPAMSALKISQQSRWVSLFSTHPPLEARIERLMNMRFV